MSLKKRLIRDVKGSFGLRIASVTLNFGTSILLARLLGKEGFGLYTYALTWPALLGIPATLGFNNLLIREVAIYRSQSSWGLLRGLLQWANAIVLVVSIGITLVALAIAFNLLNSKGGLLLPALSVALISLPIVSLTSLRLATMKGFQRVVLGQMPEMLLSPLLLLTVAITSSWFLRNNENATVWILGLRLLIATMTFVVGTLLLTKIIPQELKKAIPDYKIRTWLRDGLPFMFLGGLAVINARIDILMLGSLKGAGAVGIYAVVSRVTSLIVFALGIVNSVLSPTLATLYAEGKMEQLQRVVTRSTRLITLFALIVTISLIVLRQWILPLFGAEFIEGQTALIILSVGYLVNAMTGSVGLLLNMTRHANLSAATVGCSALLNVLLNFILIPKWGVNGAAIATATSMVLANIINAIWVSQKLGIKSTVL